MKSESKTLIYVFAASVIVWLTLSGCAKKTDPTEDTAPIKIGHVSPLTGNQAETGIDQKRGAELAVAELNEAGGILGRKIELVAYDDKADPKEANSAAKKLSADSAVVAVVGHLNSGCSIPASKIYHDNGLAMITPVSTSDTLTQHGFENVFRVCIRNSDQGSAAARFAITELGKTRFYILDDKSAYGAGIAGEFEKAAKTLGGTIVGRDSITEGDVDFRGILTKLQGKAIDFIYFGGMYPEGSLLLKQAKELGVDAPFLSGDGMFSTKLTEIAGPSAEGTIVTHIAPLEAKNEKAKEFFSAFRTKFGEDVKVYAPLSYDCVKIIAAAMERAGTTERADIIRELHSPTFAYDGVLGTTRFDEHGDTLNKNPYFYKVQSGKFVLAN